jgi:tRNA 2-thiouridine synthesizing protein A
MMDKVKLRLAIRRTDREPSGPSPDRAPGERPLVPVPAPAAALTIDALGRKCPIPIIMLAEQIRDVPVGAIVAVLADDPAAYTDIPSWCQMKAHEYAGYQDLPRGWALYIRRAYLLRSCQFRRSGAANSGPGLTTGSRQT